MSVSVEDIAAELEPETRAAIIENMAMFNGIATPRDIGLEDSDFELGANAGDLESQVPKVVAADLSSMELTSELDKRGLPATGFLTSDAKELQKAYDSERAEQISRLRDSAAETMEAEQTALTIERDKAIMARLLAGEISAFEGDDKQHVRTLVRLMLAHATKPRVAFSVLDAPCNPSRLPQPVISASAASNWGTAAAQQSFGGLSPSTGVLGQGQLSGSLSASQGMFHQQSQSLAGMSKSKDQRSHMHKDRSQFQQSSMLSSVGGRSAIAHSALVTSAALLTSSEGLLLGSAGTARALPSPLSSATARVLSKGLVGCRSLMFLDLSENRIDDLGGCFLARALRHNAFLQQLELRGNCLGPRTLAEFGRALTPVGVGPETAAASDDSSSNNNNNNNTGEDAGGAGAGAGSVSTGGVGKVSCLKGLNLESNPLTGGGSLDADADLSGVAAFASMLQANSTLKSISFFRCDLNDAGVEILVEGIRQNKSVHTCDVGHTGDTTAHTKKAMAEALRANHGLLAEVKACDKMLAEAAAKEVTAQRAAETKESRRLAYLKWMEEEKAARVAERLKALDGERSKRVELEQKLREEAASKAKAEAEAAAAASGKKKKGKGGKKKK